MNQTKIVLAALTFCFLIFSAAALDAATLDLAKTGQTICYDAGGVVIPCAGSGQDGETQMGIPWPDPRFTDNGNGTITDNLTGLIWLAQADCLGKIEWLDALAAANALADGACGLSDNSAAGDWRLPNILEAVSLMNLEVPGPGDWLETFGFSGFYGVALWSSTTIADPTGTSAFSFSSAQGFMGFGTKGNTYEAWAVRGVSTGPAPVWRTGQTICYDRFGTVIDCSGTGQDGEHQAGVEWPTPRFTDNLNGTVTDNLTGLIWLQDLDCFGDRSWDEALTDAASLAEGVCGLADGSSLGDWRLPNGRELFSTIDHQNTRPALSTGHPFINVPPHFEYSYFWSSSTWVIIPSWAWYDTLSDDGQFAFGDKATLYKVWPVRSAVDQGEIFSDGFESGNTDAWSETSP